jgi:hypothetical protein
VAGAGQLLLALVGFGLLLAWFGLLLYQVYQQINGNAEPKSVAWLGEAGGACFALAWVWSLITSLSLLREARAAAPEPPRLG